MINVPRVQWRLGKRLVRVRVIVPARIREIHEIDNRGVWSKSLSGTDTELRNNKPL